MLGFPGHQPVSLSEMPSPQGAQLCPWEPPHPTPGSGLWQVGPCGPQFPHLQCGMITCTRLFGDSAFKVGKFT